MPMPPGVPEFALLAEYNRWMNARLYAAAATLPEAELARDRGAFFGSILGTLNHVAVADTIWLKRFAASPRAQAALAPVCELPAPRALDAPLFPRFSGLRAHREWLDGIIAAWVGGLGAHDLQQVLPYANTRGERFERVLGQLLLHFFNHQTHHRGQATTLLSQAGVDVGVTDLLALIPDAGAPDANAPVAAAARTAAPHPH